MTPATAQPADQALRGINPATGEPLDPPFREATADEVDRALSSSQQAFVQTLDLDPRWPAALLDEIASQIMALGDALLERGEQETALPRVRLTGERARTTNQLKMFADIAREGSWVEAVIDTADPKRTPAPKPDLRRMLKPRGPVVVFGASNFPFAFGAVGGDTASALAAGNPVIVKGHPSHPGTSDLFGKAVDRALDACRLPKGLFTLLQGRSHELSANLVKHMLTTAVGFTGSLKAGRALFDMAAARPRPIPVYAEMGSLNPIVITNNAIAQRGLDIAKGLSASLLLGGGQFCTKPGIIFLLDSNDEHHFVANLAQQMSATQQVTMLNESLRNNFCSLASQVQTIPGVKSVLEGQPKGHAGGAPLLFETTAATFCAEPRLRHEMFGPGGIVVRCRNTDEALTALNCIEGTLTATIHLATTDNAQQTTNILRTLEQIAGRVIVNGYPTGVEVNNAIVHGGPYPATTDPNSTSVGAAAIRRFVRMIAYQDTPDALLPPSLKNSNPLGIERLIDGHRTREPIAK